MTSTEIKSLDSSHVMQTYGRFDVAIERGEGARLYSPEGREYIDFTSGIGVNSIGYGNKPWAEAIYAQALKLGHISNLFYTEPYARLAEVLTRRSGMKNVFFANAGGEANEGLIKLARKYSHDKYGDGRSAILTLRQSFHGRTVTTLAATGQEQFHKHFFPFTEGFSHIPPNDIKALENALDGVCALIVELIQGEGGVLPLDPDYVKAAYSLCRERDVLFLADEVQTGIGRTGRLFAYQNYGVLPDAVTFAKGIAGGLPMGGVLASEKCAAVLGAGDHATTFGGNPIAAAAAIEALSQLNDTVLDEVAKKGAYIKDKIAGWGLPAVGEIRGMGLMLGVSVAGASSPKALAARCIENGLLILTAGSDALRMLPPLTITYEEINAGLEILKGVLDAA
ncbi:MAG: acetylornithine/succinylornithine family transaminase [Oscillospiraceae bacterium]|jgi:acetylornithine/N-succinyldiaminopimelate aminotransferase|nr:acetylornithine/succinylornithine family transaminase [Oscillospiraceae bacterium]